MYIPVGSLNAVFILFYVLSFLKPNKKIGLKLKLLYVPFILFLINATAYKIYNATAELTPEIYKVFLFLNNIQSVFSFLFTLVVILISFIKVSQYDRSQKTYKREQFKMHLNWLKITLFLLFITTAFWGFALFKFLSDDNYWVFFNVLWVGLSVVIYWLGHLGIYKFSVLAERKDIRTFARSSTRFSITEKQKNEHIIALEKLLIEDKTYLDPSLTLQKIATQLQISKGHLSRVINNELNTSFTDYLNTLRVEEAKRYLANPDFSSYTLVAIGLEAGFNSKSTFNLAFKKNTGMTPSQFKKAPAN